MRPPEHWHRLAAVSVGLGTLLAVLSPLGAMDEDSFPISSYPMFARPRGQPTLYAVTARNQDGSERRLPAEMVGSSEVLQTKVLIQRSVEQGPEAMAELCRATAERVSRSPELGTLRSIEIVRRRFDPIGYFVDGPQPIEQERLFSCKVPRARDARPKKAKARP